MISRESQLKLLSLIGIAPLFYYLAAYLNLDFFYDEVFTLQRFVFAPFSKAFGEYTIANNHYLANVVNFLYVRLIGEQAVYSLMDHPWMMRLPELVYTVLTLITLYVLSSRYLSKTIAFLSVLMLATSIPFYNFSLQVRGYSLSMLLATAIILSIFRFEILPGIVPGAILAVLTGAFLYCMPSNLYFVMAVCLFYAAACAGAFLTQKSHSHDEHARHKKHKDTHPPELAPRKHCRYALLLAVLGLGVALAVICYLPLIGGMRNDENLAGRGLFYMPTLTDMMPSVLDAFVSWRWLVVALAFAGLIWGILTRKHRAARELLMKSLLFACICILPFLFSFVRGDRPYDRIFIVALPAFSLMIAIFISFLFEKIHGDHIIPAAILLILYCHVTFFFGIRHIHSILLEDITLRNRLRVSVIANYFQAHYRPLELVRLYDTRYKSAAIPLVVFDVDRYAMPEYLKKYNVKIVPYDTFLKVAEVGVSWYIISASDNYVMYKMPEKYPGYSFTRLNEQVQNPNLYLMKRK